MKLSHSRCQSLYVMLFVLFVIMIVPVQCISFYISQWEKAELQREVKSRAAFNSLFLMHNFETEIKNIENQLNQLIDNTDTTLQQFYVYGDSYSESDYYIALRGIIERIKPLTYNDFIDNVIVYYPSHNISVSAYSRVAQLDMQDYSKAIIAGFAQNSPIIDMGDVWYINKFFPATYTLDKENPSAAAICIQAVLSKNAVAEYLSTFTSYGGFPTLLVNHNTGTKMIDSETQKKWTEEEYNYNIQILLEENDSKNLHGNDYYTSSAHSEYLNCSILQYVPLEELFRIPNRFSRYSLILILLTVPLLLLYSVFIYRLVKYPINSMMNAFRRMRNGDLDIKINIKTSSLELRYLIDGFNDTVLRLKELINRIYIQEISANKIKLKQLQSQINPHFLFNSFFTLNHLIKEEDLENASLLTEYLGNYFKFITRNEEINIQLKSEYNSASTYLHIQQIRFDSRIYIDIADLPEKRNNILVPRLILQPILENALEYGIKKNSGKGIIRMRIIDEEDILNIQIEDNGTMLDDETISLLKRQLSGDEPVAETTAIFNIHKRLQLFFGTDFGLFLDRSELGGLSATIKIRTCNSCTDSQTKH